MNTSGEVADLMVKEGIQITESAVKLAGLGAKNLAAVLIALLQKDRKLSGKTSLRRLLKSEKSLCILQIKEADIHKFNKEAKKYGVLFTVVADKTKASEFCDIIAKQDDVTKLNYIMERMGYAAPEIKQDKADAPEQEDGKTEKKSNPRTKEYRSEKGYTARGDNDKQDNDKPSVREKIDNIKARWQEKEPQTPVKKKGANTKGKARG